MEGHIFVGILEDWLSGLTGKSTGQEKRGSKALDKSNTPIQPDDFLRFKRWFYLALRVTEVWNGEIPMTPEDVVFSTVIKRTHTRLTEALSMFTDQELVDLFGQDGADQIRGISSEVKLEESAPTMTISIRSFESVA